MRGRQELRLLSEACERNKDVILEVLKVELVHCQTVLEIGSGTGQHAVYFGKHLPHLVWQTADLAENHSSILAWIDASDTTNVRPPIELDVNQEHWPSGPVEAIFTANTLHIIGWHEVQKMFEGIGEVLKPSGVLCIYGPFNYNNCYTSQSNAQFDDFLKRRDSNSGIRDFEAIQDLARKLGLVFRHDYPMPANNRCLVWQRTTNE